MITDAKFVNYIIETLNVLRQELISLNKLNLTDSNIFLENFICYLLNSCFGYQLVNLNEEKANYPGIDLGDSKAGIGFQVTAIKTSHKINSTLEKCINHKCYQTYPCLKFFILTERQRDYSINVDKSGIEFDPNKDILDFDDLYRKTMYLSVSTRKELAEYIHEQIPYALKEIGADYYNPNPFKRLTHNFSASDWLTEGNRIQSGKLIVEHNFGYIPQVSVMKGNTEVIVRIEKTEQCVTLHANPSGWAGKVILT